MSNMTLSESDKKLTQAQQTEILRLKQAWADASASGNTQQMEQAHAAAEAIRNSAGYSGGADGSGSVRIGKTGGYTADQVKDWVQDYETLNYKAGAGWINGYSNDMNLRSMANFIRQQMQANSDAWNGADTNTRAYLHDQNLQLAKILSEAAGGAESIYNEKLGRWETTNANLGYGYNTGQYEDLDWYRNIYGMTDEQIEQYRNDTNRYRNFVDQRIIRNWTDESNGYTGLYAQFVNGPYGQLLSGSKRVPRETYIDLEGDGFAESTFSERLADYLENGPRLPALKNNSSTGAYTNQFASYVDENGVIQPGQLILTRPGGGPGGGSGGSGMGMGTTASGGMGGSGLLNAWQNAAIQQAVNSRDYAVNQAVAQLLQAQKEAEASYQTQRDQIVREERNALDNAALYAELRGDRGGIGQTQYNQIQAQAAANRQMVNAAQTQMAAQTSRQITQLRAQGEFEKADSLLEIAQTYLLKLLDLEQWAAEHQLSSRKFEASVNQWEQEYLLKIMRMVN